MFKPENREPDFDNIVAVLEKKVPSRATLFDFFINDPIFSMLTARCAATSDGSLAVQAFYNAGYDYATLPASGFHFSVPKRNRKESISINDGACISDRESFDRFVWNNPDDYSLEGFEKAGNSLLGKMKLILSGPGIGGNGVLENVIDLVGYENLCYMIYEDEELVYDIFEQVGTRLVKYYKRAVQYDFVGAIISGDDWGFNTQTMLSPKDMRRFVFPWHKQFVEIAHAAGKRAILHSCGNYDGIIDDIIYDIKYDARHSYEDNIVKVEDAYDQLSGKIAVLGGMDMDFMARKTPQEIYARATKMLEKGMCGGGYALGTGNSVAPYIPAKNYFAMLQAAFDF